MYHLLWSTKLPTWHNLPPRIVTSLNDTAEINDIDYARLIKYQTPGPSFKSILDPLVDGINANLYVVSAEPYANLDPPFKYELFDRQRHVYLDVLWFQPYHKDPSSINIALTLGLLIESGDIDAIRVGQNFI